MVDDYISWSQDTRDTYPWDQLYIEFSEEFIENNYDVIGQVMGCYHITYRNNSSMVFSWTTGFPRSLISAHLAPTKNNRKVEKSIQARLLFHLKE